MTPLDKRITNRHKPTFYPAKKEKYVVHPARPNFKLDARSGTLGAGRQTEDLDHYHAIVAALKQAQEILVVEPAQAELQRIKPIHLDGQGRVNKIVGVEALDHPVTRNYSPMRASILLQKGSMLGSALISAWFQGGGGKFQLSHGTEQALYFALSATTPSINLRAFHDHQRRY